MLAEFYLTDGTTKINLLATHTERDGIGLNQLRFARPQREADSLFAEYSTVNEVYSIRVTGRTQDIAIAYLRDLDAMLLKADGYFSNNIETGLVWLVSRAGNESNARYAVVLGGKIAEYSDIYAQPFISVTGVCILDELDLGIERRAWQGTPPFSPKTTTIKSATVTTTKHYIDNRFTENMISLVQVFDASAGTYTTFAAPTYPGGSALFPAIPAASDILYIGFNPKVAGTTALPDSIYFNIVAAAFHITTAVWEFWNGAWTAFTVVDTTALLTTSGTVSWPSASINDTWINSSINGVLANWLRLRITAVAANPTPPTANVIAQPRNYLEISGVKGDIPALAEVVLTTAGYQTGNNDSWQSYLSSVRMGLRSTERGATFYPWLIPTAPYAAPVYGGSTLITNYSYLDTGQTYRVTAGVQFEDFANYKMYGRTLDGVTSDSKDYFGTFRAYLRALYVGSFPELISMRLVLYDATAIAPQIVATGPTVTPNARNNVYFTPELYDMGQFTIGARDFANEAEKVGSYTFAIQMMCSNSVEEVDVFDLCLLPVDEWSGSFVQPGHFWAGNDVALIGSATHPKRQIRGVYLLNNKVVSGYVASSSGPLFFQPGKTQRLYFLMESRIGTFNGARQGDDYLGSQYSHPLAVTVTHHERYLGFRGND